MKHDRILDDDIMRHTEFYGAELRRKVHPYYNFVLRTWMCGCMPCEPPAGYGEDGCLLGTAEE